MPDLIGHLKGSVMPGLTGHLLRRPSFPAPTGNLFRRPSFPAPTGNLLTAVLAVLFFASCGGKEPVDPTPPTPPAKDTKAPTITVSANTVNVIAGLDVTL